MCFLFLTLLIVLGVVLKCHDRARYMSLCAHPLIKDVLGSVYSVHYENFISSLSYYEYTLFNHIIDETVNDLKC
jgi:hypothetical protein